MEQTSQAALRAKAFFEEGYNCSQSVFLAFADRYGVEKELACRLAASFGGGIGRLREVCGAVSGMALVCGLEGGATEGRDKAKKAANYKQMQELAARFQAETGSLICRELLGLRAKAKEESTASAPSASEQAASEQVLTAQTHEAAGSRDALEGGMGQYQPQERDEKYYAARPCREMVGLAAAIVEQWLQEQKEVTP